MTESKTKPPKKETVETLMEWMSQKLDEYLKESRESRIKMEEERKASEKERKERDERIAEERKERDERSEKEWADFRASMKAMQKEMGGIGESNGDMAETYFYNSFDKTMQFAGQKYDAIDRNLKRKNKELKLQGEYDIILYNCSSVAIIETKYKARKDDVEDLLSYVPVFKQLFPEYANFNLYLGLAAFHFEKKAEKETIKQGIAVIKQVGDNMVVNDGHLRVF